MPQRPDSKSETLEKDLTDLLGPDPILQILKTRGTPVTRESYLALSDPEADPAEFQGAEIESGMPEQIRLSPPGADSSEPQP
jgi:hypothetical protein